MGLYQGRKKLAISWALPLLLIIVCILAALGGDEAREWLKYDRFAIQSGEFWRLVTGHFAHLSAAHLALNLVGLILVWLLVGSRATPTAWVSVTVFTVFGINLGFWFLDPNLLWYVGLSGLLHGLLVAGSLAGIREFPAESLIILAVLLAKVVYEQVAGPLPGSEATSGGPVVVNAHLYGAAAGLIAGLPLCGRDTRSSSI